MDQNAPDRTGSVPSGALQKAFQGFLHDVTSAKEVIDGRKTLQSWLSWILARNILKNNELAFLI
jgi:hypothetical protein